MLEILATIPFSLLFIMLLSMLVCPLCGRLCSLHHFDPSRFEDDIFTEKVQGLGRGKGFRTAEARSVFESARSAEVEEALRKIYDRALEILAMLVSNDFVTLSDITERLGLQSDLPLMVLRFLRLDSVEELLYDADEETERLAVRLRRMALEES